MKSTWTPVWRVSNEGTTVVAYEAALRTRERGNVIVRAAGGARERHGGYWFDLYFGATPGEAIVKFQARQAQRLMRLEQDRAEILQQLANVQALRATRQPEATH